MNKFRLAIVFAALVTLLSGCSILGPTMPDKEPGYTYEEGFGKTESEAYANAQENLSNRISVSIQSQVQLAQKVLARDDEQGVAQSQTQQSFESKSSSYSYVTIEGLEKVFTKKSRGEYKVVIKVSNANMDRARDRADRQAPALAYISLLDRASEPGERLRIALQGLEKAERYHLLTDKFNDPSSGSLVTIGTYFKNVAVRALARLKVLPIIESNNRIHFVVINAQTLEPQPMVALKVGSQLLKTNQNGQTKNISLASLPSYFEPKLLGYVGATDLRSLDQTILVQVGFSKKELRHASKRIIYVNTTPKNKLIHLWSGQTKLDAQSTPAIFTTPASAKDLRLTVHSTKDFKGKDQAISKVSSHYNYYLLDLTKKHYGVVDLSVKGHNSVIKLRRLQHGLVDTPEDNHVNKEVREDRYQAIIYRQNKAGQRVEKYQRVVDVFDVYEGHNISRAYQAPKNRHFHNDGYYIGLDFGLGTDPSNDYTLGDDGTYGDELAKDDPTANLMLRLRGMKFLDTLSLALAFNVEFRNQEFESDTYGKYEMDTLGGGAGIGFWTSQLSWASAAWVTANYNFEHTKIKNTSDNYLGNDIADKYDPFNTSYPYADLGLLWAIDDTTIGFGARLADPKDGASYIYISVGSSGFNPRYELKDTTSAVSGEHYNL